MDAAPRQVLDAREVIMTPVRQLSTAKVASAWERLLWGDPAAMPRWQRRLRQPLRLLYALGRDLASGRLSLEAMSLVYTTLLSLVPLLAVSFSVLKGFGVHNQLEPLLMRGLSPLGAGGEEIATRLIVYVDNTNVRVLGAVGLALLLYSVISLISKIEQVFNMTWRIDQPRPIAERFSRYLSVLLVGPVLVFAAFATSASLRNNVIVHQLIAIEPLGWLLAGAERLVPLALITLAFGFVYSFVPNTRVRLLPALVGALIGGLLWLAAGTFFAQFMAGSTRFAAIYSGLAILILFMIWIYIAWLIVLIGANIAFYTQYPEYLASRDRDFRLSNRLRERVALQLMQQIVKSHYAGGGGATEEALAHTIGAPLAKVRQLIAMLRDGDFVVPTATEPTRFLPAQPPEQVPVQDLVRYVRRFGETSTTVDAMPVAPEIAAIELDLQRALDNALADMSLKDLAVTDGSAMNRSDPAEAA
jgi:membrane protein